MVTRALRGAADVEVTPPSKGEPLLPPITQCYKNGFVVGGLEANAEGPVYKETAKDNKLGGGKLPEATEPNISRGTDSMG